MRPEAMARGFLVLEDRPFALTSVSDSARVYVRRTQAVLLTTPEDELVEDDDSTVLNACFVLDHRRHAPTYAGLEEAAITRWTGDSTGAISMRFYQSPDAGYVATIVAARGALSGTGRSWGPESGKSTRDFIVGRRIGPPDRARCVRSIEEMAARERQRRAAPGGGSSHPPRRARPSQDVVASAISAWSATLRFYGEVGGEGPWAFDPRILRVGQGAVPPDWPDSVAPHWVGDVRDSAFARGTVTALLAELNAGDSVPGDWVACAPRGSAGRCMLAAFPAIVSVSQPWIQGDSAQLVVYVKHRPAYPGDPEAWIADVVRLHRTGGVWRATTSYNLGGSWRRGLMVRDR